MLISIGNNLEKQEFFPIALYAAGDYIIPFGLSTLIFRYNMIIGEIFLRKSYPAVLTFILISRIYILS